MDDNMPPKKVNRGGHEKSMDPNINPRVIIRPLRANCSEDSRYSVTTLPPTASLFNKPENSDIKLKVGDRSYYAHRLILSAASEVFQSMFGNKWAERGMSEIELQEDRECVKVFESFLYYFYSGTIMINEDDVTALFMLADKYIVKPLYDECVKVIENGLKVYTVMRVKNDRVIAKESGNAGPSTSTGGTGAPASGYYKRIPESDDSQSSFTSEGESSESESEAETGTTHLVGMETFPLTLVMKMLKICQNQRIVEAARYNLEARLCKLITHENYGLWNDMDKDLLVEMLSDKYFYCKEFVLFKAAKSWLAYRPDRQDEQNLSQVFCTIRYPLLEPEELYEVENDCFVQNCPHTLELVQNAIRYKLFKTCPKAAKKEHWCGIQFEARQIKD